MEHMGTRQNESYRRILVLRPGALGDALLTLPTLQALDAGLTRRAGGTTERPTIELSGHLPVLDWLPGRSVVTAASSFDHPDWASLFVSTGTPAPGLQGYLDRFDLVLSYATPPEHPFARNLARAARGRVLCHDARPARDPGMHMSAYLQQPLRELGLAPIPDFPALHLRTEEQKEAAAWWQTQGLGGQAVVAIHPGSGSPAKNWPAGRFAEVARTLSEAGCRRVLWLGGPADAAALASLQALQDAEPALWLRDATLPYLAAVLQRCTAYLGNDSGVSHLAAALGVPSVVIFGPTDPRVWAPRGASVTVVRAPMECGPCDPEHRKICQIRACLEAVDVSQVLQALDAHHSVNG